MKVVRDNSVWASLLRVISSAAGRRTIEYISLTGLEFEELEEHYGVDFVGTRPGSRFDMRLESFDLEGSIPVRIEEQDKVSRARRKVGGDGRINTR